jgi:1,2-diacylglycerol 3-beta-glucosyltransferase
MIGLASTFLSSAALTVLCLAFVAAGCIAAVFAVHLLVLSVAALFYSVEEPQVAPSTRLLVLVPAHNESVLIAACVRSLRNQIYPADLYKIVVVADNCTDGTAEVAAQAGAHVVMARDEPNARGKGRALRWALDRLLATEPAAAGVVVVDADSVADPRFLVRLVQPFEAGARAVQGDYVLYPNDSTGAALRASAFLLINRVRPAGRAVLGLSASHLAGNGMLLARDLLVAVPWEAFTSAEDAEYSLRLRTDGISIAFAGGAFLISPAAPNPQAAAQQQLRWEGGKVYLARTHLPRLTLCALRERRLALLGLAFDLAVPPVGFLAAAVLGGSLIGACLLVTGALPVWALGPWLVAGASIPLFVLIGLKAGHAPMSGYVALLRAPLFVLTKILQTRRVVSFRGDTWVRTERASQPKVRSGV